MISPITTQSSSDLSRTPPSVKVKEEFSETYMSPNANLKMLFSVISPELKKTFSSKGDDENPNHNKTIAEFESNNTKENYYIRSSKSLNVLCQKFLALFNEYPTETVVLQLDQVALQLKVERRRIYDIINIMESLEMATKIGKNQYQWHGKSNLKTFLQKLKDYGDLLKAACKETVNDTTKASDLPLSLGVKESKFEKMNKSLSQEKCATTNNHENMNVFSIENKQPFRSCLKLFSNAQNTTSEDDGNNQIWNDIQQSYSNFNNSFSNVNFNVNSPSQIYSPYPYFNAYGFPTFRQSLGILSQKFLIHLLSAQDKMVFMEDMAKIIDGPEQFSTTFLQRENKTFSNFSAFNAKTDPANYFYSPVDNNQLSIQNNFLNGEHMKCFTNFAHLNSCNMSFSTVNDLNNKSNNESNTSTEKKPKNRVRRLYDIANVLSSLALVEKVRIKSAQGYNRAGFAYIGPTLQERLIGKYGGKTQKVIDKTDSEGLTLPENSVQPTETLENGHQNLFLKNVLHTVGPHRHSLFKPPQVFEQKSCSYLKSCPSKLASHSSHSFSCILPRNNATNASNGTNLDGNANANNSIIVPNPQFGVYKTPIYPKYNEETNLNPGLLNGPNIIYTKPPSILTHQTLTKNTNAAPLSSNGKKFIRVNSYAFAKTTIHNTCLSDSKVVSDTHKSTLVMMNNPSSQKLVCTVEGKNIATLKQEIISPLVMCQLGTTKQKTPFVKNFTTTSTMETKCEERSSKLTRENSFTLMYLESLLKSQITNHVNNSNLVETIDNGITNSKNINSEGGNLAKTNSLSYLGYPSVSNILFKQEPINSMEKSNLNTANKPGIEIKENILSQKRKLSFSSPQRINTLPLQNITNKDITIQKQNNSSFLGFLPKNNFMNKTNMYAAKKLIYNKNTMKNSQNLESNKENIY